MFDQILAGFGMSPHGQQASQVLAQQGWNPQQQQQIFAAALPAAANAMQAQTQGSPQPALSLFNIFGGHPGRQFLLGAVAGVLRGDGIVGSLGDGATGMIGGHIAEVIAQRLGMSPQFAGNVTAALTPFITHFVYEHLLGHPAVQQQFGPPGMMQGAVGGGMLGGLFGGLFNQANPGPMYGAPQMFGQQPMQGFAPMGGPTGYPQQGGYVQPGYAQQNYDPNAWGTKPDAAWQKQAMESPKYAPGYDPGKQSYDDAKYAQKDYAEPKYEEPKYDGNVDDGSKPWSDDDGKKDY